MRFRFDGEMFKGTHITGPTHNYLGLVVSTSPLDDWPLVEINSHSNESRRLEMPEVRGWIIEGVRRANEALGANHGIARAEFVISDSHYPEIYKALAEKIVRIAHTSPSPAVGDIA